MRQPTKSNSVKRKSKPSRPAQLPIRYAGMLKELGGSYSDDFNELLIEQALQTMWQGGCDLKHLERKADAMRAIMFGIRPRDEIEGMLSAQIYGAHNAVMEQLRRAMILARVVKEKEANENLKRANELMRSFSMLVQTLCHYRRTSATEPQYDIHH